MTPEQIASLAQSLEDNEAFQLALDKTRTGALEALASADATDSDFIRTQQATIRVVDEIKANLAQFIRSGAPKKPAGIA